MKIAKEVISSIHGEITLYKITNSHGSIVELSSLGAGITSIIVPDVHGNLDNVVISYANATDYFNDGPCAGKTPGRYANRIANGKFTLDGTEYQLAINNGPNALHGGPMGFQNQLWDSKFDENQGKVIFSHTSKDGYEGYPGTLNAHVTYTWSEQNQLTIEYHATTDKTTVINLTNHTYFNLSGQGTILHHKLWLNSTTYLPTDSTLIPIGTLEHVTGTPMDFTQAKPLGQDIKTDFPALNYGKGYDNCWVIQDWAKDKLQKVATLTEDHTQRRLEVFTTQPAVQVYTGNWLSGCPNNKTGISYNDYDGVAIECQGMPDAPNKPQFPTQELHAGATYNQIIKFSFSINAQK
ncbi:MAG: aldose epimerase family protein [Muribaculaceae bacterium]